MECPKCNGSGRVENPRYFNGQYSCTEAWERGYDPSIKCRKCNGTGYIIGNISDIVNRLRAASNGVTITTREAKQMLEAILK